MLFKKKEENGRKKNRYNTLSSHMVLIDYSSINLLFLTKNNNKKKQTLKKLSGPFLPEFIIFNSAG